MPVETQAAENRMQCALCHMHALQGNAGVDQPVAITLQYLFAQRAFDAPIDQPGSDARDNFPDITVLLMWFRHV